MRIAFLCSGLEPGRDGVGDYTRRLAANCILQGHECTILALDDRHTERSLSGAATGEKCIRETQNSDGVDIPCLRCSVSLPRQERIQRIREYLAAFDPDWVSLQFVPYGFHPKGLPWRFARDFEPMIGARPLQIMFHELWIGNATGASWKDRLIGALQRRCILRMLRRLKPKLLHTSNATYVRLLERRGFTALPLPLFGNIPVSDTAPDAALPPEISDAGVPSDACGRSGWWLGVFFATLHPEWKPEPLLPILRGAANRAGKRICLISAGRQGAAGEALWEQMTREYGRDFLFVRTGEQAAERISALLQIANFGVVSTPWNLIGKSGSAAAMLDHGLPVIVTRKEETAEASPVSETPPEPLFHRCDPALEDKLVAGLKKRAPVHRAREISVRFIDALRKPGI